MRITRRQLFGVGAGVLGAVAFGLRPGTKATEGHEARLQTPDALHRADDRSCQCPVCQPRAVDTGLA